MLAHLFCVLFLSFLSIRLFWLNTAQNNASGEPEGCPFAIGEPRTRPFAIGEPSLFKSVTCIILHICIFRCLQIPDSARLRPIPAGRYFHIFYA